MNYFKDAIHIVYLVKLLQEIGKFDVIGGWKDEPIAADGDIDFDTIYNISLSVMESVFEYYYSDYNEEDGIDVMVLSDKVIVDYYLLAGKYGKQNGLADDDNPYFHAAEKEAADWFYFSYSLGWRLTGCTNPKKAYKSKLVILTYCDGEADIIGVAAGIAGMYKFFSLKCDELRKLISVNAEKKPENDCIEFPIGDLIEKEAAAA